MDLALAGEGEAPPVRMKALMLDQREREREGVDGVDGVGGAVGTGAALALRARPARSALTEAAARVAATPGAATTREG